MKDLMLLLLFSILIQISANGQTTSGNGDQQVVIYVDRQTGEIFNQGMDYQLMQWYQGVPKYVFKKSGDSTFVYFDKDPVGARVIIDSVAKVKLNTPVELQEFIDSDDIRYSKTELLDKVIVLNFWATWCAPCLEEFPAMNQLVDAFQDKNVLFLAPTRESYQQIDGFFSQREFNYTIIPDSDDLADELNVYSLPTHIIIDKSHIVRFIQIGGDSETILDELTSEINKYL